MCNPMAAAGRLAEIWILGYDVQPLGPKVTRYGTDGDL